MSAINGREVVDYLSIVCPRIDGEVEVPVEWTFISDIGRWDLVWPCRECDDLHPEELTLEVFDALMAMGYDFLPEFVTTQLPPLDRP